jgi:hypothetical protein
LSRLRCERAAAQIRPCERSGSRAHDRRLVREANRHLEEDRRRLFHPCFATRLGGVSGGKESQAWHDSSHTAMVGAGKFGSAKLPMATATYPGKPSPCQ